MAAPGSWAVLSLGPRPSSRHLQDQMVVCGRFAVAATVRVAAAVQSCPHPSPRFSWRAGSSALPPLLLSSATYGRLPAPFRGGFLISPGRFCSRSSLSRSLRSGVGPFPSQLCTLPPFELFVTSVHLHRSRAYRPDERLPVVLVPVVRLSRTFDHPYPPLSACRPWRVRVLLPLPSLSPCLCFI